MDEASPSVRSVLRAASETGLKVAFIHRYLKMINHGDADDLCRDLSNGFPLVGDVPISPVAPLAEVRTATLPLADFRGAAEELADGLLRQHAVAPRTEDGIEAERKVFSQTLEDIALGRMGPLVRPGQEAFPSYTRRFGVSQSSSLGVT